jgi:hypothetical protein
MTVKNLSLLAFGQRASLALVLVSGAAGAGAACSSSNSGTPSTTVNQGDDASSDTNPQDGGGSTDDAANAGHTSTSSDASGDAKGSSSSTVADGGDLPAGDAGANAYCTAACDREAMCLDASADAATCHCSPGTLVFYRSDYVSKLAACESQASCSDLITDAEAPDSGLETCAANALASTTPTAAVESLCAQIGDSTCQTDYVQDCPDTFKAYSDSTVSAVSTCISDPNCSDHQACVTTALTPTP